MTYEEAPNFYQKLRSMKRYDLIKLCDKQHRRLERLAQICDVEDVFNALQEQVLAQLRVERRDKQIGYAKDYMSACLEKKGIKSEKWMSLKQLTDLMIESDKNSINQ